jgi:glutamate carboxypeptidase
MKKKDKRTRVALRRPMASVSMQTISAYASYLEDRREDLIETIRQMTELESPSEDKAAVDRLGTWLMARFEKLGGKVRVHAQPRFGNHLQVDFPGRDPKQKPILLLGHFDTVYELGILAQMPCKVEKGRIYGPGVFDMKSGIAFMLHAIETLQAIHGGLPRSVCVWLVTDEEVGSESSRAMTENLAKQSAAVLVLEPSAGAKGALKTSRKGVGEYTVRVIGRAAHAGLDPSKGQSAVVELAHQIARIAKFGEPKRGLTVNVGVIRGGTRTNVIAAEAVAEVDVRIERRGDAPRIDRKFRGLKPVNGKCKLEITGGVNRPPMERGAGTVALFAKAKATAREIGWNLEETAVGGGSDGNFTAALGIPTLDGLGGVGDGAHAAHEHVLIQELSRRAALIAGLLASL